MQSPLESQNSPYYPKPQEGAWMQVAGQISSSRAGLHTLVMNNSSINKKALPFSELSYKEA